MVSRRELHRGLARELHRGTGLTMADIWDGLSNEEKSEIQAWLRLLTSSKDSYQPGTMIITSTDKIMDRLKHPAGGTAPRYYANRINQECLKFNGSLVNSY